MRLSRFVTGGLFLLAGFCTAALAQLPQLTTDYRIGPRDLLKIEVREDSSLNRESRVNERGAVEIPQIGEVSVAGFTVSQASDALRQALEKYLQRASVTLEIIEYRSSPISVTGAVQKPGRLPFSGRYTLLDALTEAGGITAEAGDKIFIRREAENGLSDQLEINVRELYFDMDPKVNVPVFANDFIHVARAYEVTVHCVGEVKSPGAQVFRSTEPMTVATAIAKAGGTTENASSKIFVKRGDEQITLNIKRILAGTDKDFKLMAGDIVIVKESFF